MSIVTFLLFAMFIVSMLSRLDSFKRKSGGDNIEDVTSVDYSHSPEEIDRAILRGLDKQHAKYGQVSENGEDKFGVVRADEIIEKSNKMELPDDNALQKEMFYSVFEQLEIKHYEDENGVFIFKCFDENFIVEFNGTYIIDIIDPRWYSLSKDDIMWNHLGQIIDEMNYSFGYTLFKLLNEDESAYMLNTKYRILWSPDIAETNRKDYLASVITGFFEVKKAFIDRLEPLVEFYSSAHFQIGYTPEFKPSLN